MIDAAIKVAKIATGDIEDEKTKSDAPAVQFARSGGLKGSRPRAKSLTPQRRREIAKLAAQERWKSKEK